MTTGATSRVEMLDKCDGKHHKEKQLELVCALCHELVCVSCITTTHMGHTFVNLDNAIPAKGHDLQQCIDNSNPTELPHIQECINAANEDLQRCGNHFVDVGRYIHLQGEMLKEQVDAQTASNLSVNEQLKEDNLVAIENYIAELEQRRDTLLGYVLASGIDKPGSNVDIPGADPLPVSYRIDTACFVPNKDYC